MYPRAYLREGGSRGSTPPNQKIFRFFFKSEGKKVERKREKNKKRWWWGGGGGLIQLNC